MTETLPQEQAGNQADIFDEIGSALEELIGMVGPEDTLFALEEALKIAAEMAEGAPAMTPEPAQPASPNGFNAMMGKT